MPAVIKRPILSSSDPANTFPWAKITFDPVTRSVTISEFNGLKDEAKHSVIRGSRTVSLKPGKLTEKHALIVTDSGALAFLPFSELPPTCYAHLAFYDPVTQTVEVMDFVDSAIGG